MPITCLFPHLSFVVAAFYLLSLVWLLETPMDCIDSSVHGICQQEILEWIAISFCRCSSQPTDWTQVSCILLHWQADFFFLPLSHLGSPKELRNVLKVELGEYEEGVLQAKKKLGFVHEDSWFTLELSVGIEIRGFSGYCSTDCKDLKDPNRKANGSS